MTNALSKAEASVAALEALGERLAKLDGGTATLIVATPEPSGAMARAEAAIAVIDEVERRIRRLEQRK